MSEMGMNACCKLFSMIGVLACGRKTAPVYFCHARLVFFSFAGFAGEKKLERNFLRKDLLWGPKLLMMIKKG